VDLTDSSSLPLLCNILPTLPQIEYSSRRFVIIYFNSFFQIHNGHNKKN
jgi:hypothetical protein